MSGIIEQGWEQRQRFFGRSVVVTHEWMMEEPHYLTPQDVVRAYTRLNLSPVFETNMHYAHDGRVYIFQSIFGVN